jgi:hypothetical protein
MRVRVTRKDRRPTDERHANKEVREFLVAPQHPAGYLYVGTRYVDFRGRHLGGVRVSMTCSYKTGIDRHYGYVHKAVP